MKKKYFKLASLFLLSSLLIFSCNNPFNVFEESPEPLEDPSEKKYSPELENQKKGGITISFVEPESQRTVLPDVDITKLTSIILTGQKSGESTVQNLGSWTSVSQLSGETISLEEGQWSLEISANNDFLVFNDTKTVNVTIGQSQNVSFVLSADSTYGGLDYKLTFEGSAAKVDFSLSKYNGSTFTEVVHNPDYTVSVDGSARSINYSRLAGNSIEEGTYRMVVKFYGDTAGTVLLNTYSEIINIKAGFISKSTDKTINLNQMYSITYKTEYDVDLVPGDYTMTGSLPLNYSLHTGAITLPTLSKTGYIFEGWYDTAPDSYGLFTGTKVEEISATETGDKTLWASFTIELKEGPAINTEIRTWNIASRIIASATPPAEGTTPIKYLDTLEANVPVWWDSAESCIKYYAAGYTNGSRKLKMRPDSSTTFKNCGFLAVLDITPFDTSAVTNMSQMFYGDSSLETVYVSESFTTDSVTESTNMFSSCSKIKGEKGFAYATSNPRDKTYAKINTDTVDGYFSSQPDVIYYITYELNHGTNAAGNPASYTPDSLPGSLADPTGQNSDGDEFHFEGWYTTSNFASGTQVTAITDTSYGNVILYAKWEVPYRVKHHFENADDTEYTLAQDKTETKWGYAENLTAAVMIATSGTNILAGSYYVRRDGFNDPTITQETISADGSTVVNIYYNRKNITVTFDLDGGNIDGDISNVERTGKYGASMPAVDPDTVSKTGYTLNSRLNGSTVNGFNIFENYKYPYQNITYKANWYPATNTPYTVKHMQQDKTGSGYTLATTENKTGTTGDTTAAAAKTYTGFAPQAITQKTIAADGSTVVEIKYDRNTYSVTYSDGVDDETITVPSAQTGVRYDATVNVNFTTSVTRTGYTFAGWSDGSTTYTSGGTSTFEMPDNAVTLTARWTANTNTVYVVKHMQQDATGSGYTVATTENKTGTTGGTTAAAAKTYTGFTNQTVSQKTIAADGSTVVEIKYDRKTYSVTYDDGVTSATITVPSASSTVRYGATFSPSFTGIGTRTGYTFAGWKNGSTTYTSTGTNTFTMPNSAVTLTAQWTPTEYSIIFNTNSGTFSSSYTKPSTYTIESPAITLPTSSNITRSGFAFGGWYTTSTFTGDAQTTIPNGSTGNKTYYANWIENVNVDEVLSQIENAGANEEIVISGALTTTDFANICSKIKAKTTTLKLDLSGVVGITTLTSSHLSGATKLKSLKLPETLTTIQSLALYNIGSNMTAFEITIPASVTSIGDQAFFNGCYTAIKVDSGNQYYSSYNGDLYDKDCKTFKEHAYKGYTSVTVKTGTEVIASQAFAAKNDVTSITLPASLKTIKANAFANINSDWTITIKSLSSTLTFEASSFNQNNHSGSVKTINYNGTLDHFVSHTVFENNWNSLCLNDTNQFIFTDQTMSWAEFMTYYSTHH